LPDLKNTKKPGPKPPGLFYFPPTTPLTPNSPPLLKLNFKSYRLLFHVDGIRTASSSGAA